MKKLTCLFVTAIVSSFLIMTSSVYAAVVNTYNSGDLVCTYDDATRTLSISGSGKMADYTSGVGANNAPWKNNIIYNVNVGKDVTHIGTYAFYYCMSLENVTFEEGSQLASIGRGAFTTTSIETITFPATLETLGYNIFESCDKLASINVEENSKFYASEDGVLFSKDKTKLIKYPSAKPDTTYTVPDGVEVIEGFDSNHSILEVTIPASVKNIGTFKTCLNLQKVNIPSDSKLEAIDSYAFERCNKLEKIKLPDSVTRIGNSAFYYCSALTEINIPANLTSISEDTFGYCKNLTKVNIPENSQLLFISEDAFYTCKGITEITIPSTVKSIGNRAFAGCTGLVSVNINKNSALENIGNSAFNNCSSLKSFVLPKNVTTLGDSCFNSCTALEDFSVDEENQSFSCDEYGVLFDATKTEIIMYPPNNTAKKYILPNTVTTIRTGAFSVANNLYEVVLPEGLTSINSKAFSACKNLSVVNIPSTVTTLSSSIITGCSSLISIIVPETVTFVGGQPFNNYSFTVYGKAGTKAESMSKQYNYNFADITDKENIITVTNKYDNSQSYISVYDKNNTFNGIIAVAIYNHKNTLISVEFLPAKNGGYTLDVESAPQNGYIKVFWLNSIEALKPLSVSSKAVYTSDY